MCKSNYVSTERLEQHIQDKHTSKGGWLHCQLCEYKFKKAHKLTEHMVACHDEGLGAKNIAAVEEHACSLCNFTATTSFNLVQHQNKKHSEQAGADGQFTCGSCAFKAATLNAIKSHRYLTHFKKNLQDVDFDISQLVSCPVCSAQFPGKECLRKHLLERHNMDPGIPGTGRVGGPWYFHCVYCDATFQYLSKLETHEKAKHNELPSQVSKYCCTKCSFKPMTMFALEVHMKKTHGGMSPTDKLRQAVKKPDIPIAQMKFSNSLLKFRSMEGLPSGAIQPLSSLLKSESKQVKTKETNKNAIATKRSCPVTELIHPPLKKLKVAELSKTLANPPISFRAKPSSLPSPIMACTLCPFR